MADAPKAFFENRRIEMPSNIKGLRQRAGDHKKALRALLDKAAGENRDLNETEAAQYDDGIKALTAVEKQIDREQALLERERTTDAVEDPNERAAGAAGAPGQKVGFASLGEMLKAVVTHERSNGRNSDPRLHAATMQAAASGMSEAVPSDGGFLVQKDFSGDLITRVYETGQIASRVRRIPVGAHANGVKINAIDEDSRADGSRWGGVLAYWINEADSLTATKPKFRQIELQLQKLIALCYSTDELLADAAALEAVISQAFSEEITFKLEDAILNGTGAGQPLGVLSSAAVVQVAKDSGDSTATISTNDVLAMWSRLWARSRQSAVWFINQDVEPKLYPLTLGSGTAVQLLYTPPGQNGNQYGKLLGRDVIPTEHNATLGTPGDIVLADMSQYLLIDKGAPRQDYSIHVRFLNDEGVFRFVYRVDGQPAWKKPLTPKNGANTYAPFVSLATRP
jgi:HK97 family phage major capsid protein